MPLQLRTPTARTPRAPPGSPTHLSPNLLPLSHPGKRARGALPPLLRSRRRPTLLLLAMVLLMVPLWHRSAQLDASLSALIASLRPDDSAPHPRPRTVLVAPASGGIGNQIYFLLSALYLARKAGLNLVVPSIPGRGFGSDSAVDATEERAGGDFWDLRRLSEALPGSARVLPALPDACDARFDTVYVSTRSTVPLGPDAPPPVISSRAKQAACFLVGDPDKDDEEVDGKRNDTNCLSRALEGTPVERRVLPLSRPPDEYFLDELEMLQHARVLPTGRADEGRPACVILDGHSFNIAGRVGHEYLYSFMHYLEHAPRIIDLARQWRAENLAVVHLRYDENECAVTKEVAGRVCIRARLASKREDTVYWASVTELVSGVVKAMRAERVGTVYLAASPYVPEEILAVIQHGLAKQVHVAERVDAGLDHNEQNFVERELAVAARCFIGDFASTWSGTVYYKRRTMGRRTLWTSELLGRNGSLGYYAATAQIPPPEYFEARFLMEVGG